MDNTQKGAVIALVAVGVALSVYVVNTVNTESGKLDAAEQAREEHSIMCENWLNDLDDRSAEYEGREDSLGGAFDLSGDLAVLRNQLNLDTDRYNYECAGTETNFYEENL
jgi:hypothetical protein